MIVETTVLKPTFISRLISWLALGIMLLYTYIIFEDRQLLTFKSILVMAIGFVIATGFLLSRNAYIILNNEGIIHHNIRNEKFIAYSDIVMADLVTHYHGHGYSVKWEFRTLHEKMITMPHFGKKNMRLLADALVTKLPAENLGARVVKIAEGKRVIFF